MCGSGTILTEAALMAHNVAPGLLRQEWSLTQWHDYDSLSWENVLEQARGETVRDWRGVIAGCDTHAVRSSSLLNPRTIAARTKLPNCTLY